jgi:hypothetical protein
LTNFVSYAHILLLFKLFSSVSQTLNIIMHVDHAASAKIR